MLRKLVFELKYWLCRRFCQPCEEYFAWEMSMARKAGWKVGYDLGYEDGKAGRDKLVPPPGGS